MKEAFQNLLSNLVAWGPGGLLFAALLDGAGLPIPGGVDALILYLSSQRPLETLWLVLICTFGSTAGNFFLFMLARRGGKAFLENRASKRSLRLRHWFDRYGLLTVFVSALIPLPVMPMKIFVLCAGALGSAPGAFLMAFLGGRIPRYLGLAYLGRQLGSDAVPYLKAHALELTVFGVGLFALLLLIVKWAAPPRPEMPTL